MPVPSMTHVVERRPSLVDQGLGHVRDERCLDGARRGEGRIGVAAKAALGGEIVYDEAGVATSAAERFERRSHVGDLGRVDGTLGPRGVEEVDVGRARCRVEHRRLHVARRGCRCRRRVGRHDRFVRHGDRDIRSGVGRTQRHGRLLGALGGSPRPDRHAEEGHDAHERKRGRLRPRRQVPYPSAQPPYARTLPHGFAVSLPSCRNPAPCF